MSSAISSGNELDAKSMVSMAFDSLTRENKRLWKVVYVLLGMALSEAGVSFAIIQGLIQI